MNRRSFLKSVGALTGVATGVDAEDKPPELADVEFETRTVNAEVVGSATPIILDPELVDNLPQPSDEFPNPVKFSTVDQ